MHHLTNKKGQIMKIRIDDLDYDSYGIYTGYIYVEDTDQEFKVRFEKPDIYLTREPRIRNYQEGGIYADPFDINFIYFYEIDEDENNTGTPTETVKNAIIEKLEEELIEREING